MKPCYGGSVWQYPLEIYILKTNITQIVEIFLGEHPNIKHIYVSLVFLRWKQMEKKTIIKCDRRKCYYMGTYLWKLPLVHNSKVKNQFIHKMRNFDFISDLFSQYKIQFGLVFRILMRKNYWQNLHVELICSYDLASERKLSDRKVFINIYQLLINNLFINLLN